MLCVCVCEGVCVRGVVCEEEGEEEASEPLSWYQKLLYLHSAEEEAIFVSRVLGGKVVEVEDAYPKDGEVGTHTQVGHDNN